MGGMQGEMPSVDRLRGRAPRSGFSLVEVLAVVAIVGVLAALLLPALARAREAGRRATCQSNLQQWGLAFKMYAGETPDGAWPPMQGSTRGTTNLLAAFCLSPWTDALYPEYVSDLHLFSCPSDPDSLGAVALGQDLPKTMAERPWLAGRSYAYLGWVIDKADAPLLPVSTFPGATLLAGVLGADINPTLTYVSAQLIGGLDAQLRAHPAESLLTAQLQDVLDQDIQGVAPHPDTHTPLGNGSGDTIFRLREGIERFLITDVNNAATARQAQSEVWVMFDQSVAIGSDAETNHQPGGANVLYLDGHVAYLPYTHGPYDPQVAAWTDGPASPPVSPSIARTVGALGAAR